MKTSVSFKTGVFLCAAIVLFGMLFEGCKTAPKIDWNSRIGNYTYDQAVAELAEGIGLGGDCRLGLAEVLHRGCAVGLLPRQGAQHRVRGQFSRA